LVYLWTPLHCSSDKGHLNIVQILVSQGANINSIAKGCPSGSPLHLALNNNYINIVMFLISQKANLFLVDEDTYESILVILYFISHLIMVITILLSILFLMKLMLMRKIMTDGHLYILPP